jgi:phosphatidylserine decarboxylase
MRIHREGKSILITLLGFLLIVNIIVTNSYRVTDNVQTIVTLCSLILYGWVVYFFRSPKRNILIDDAVVLVPADGKIIDISEVVEDEYFKDKRIKVSIFMSPFNVHVNRAPISGKVKLFKYHPGKYLVAFHPKSSKKNERTTIVLENKDGFQLLFRQIAGLLARRIRFYYNQNETVLQGTECGFIKFGSRADVYLPLGSEILVKLGDRVKGGLSVLAKVNNTKEIIS